MSRKDENSRAQQAVRELKEGPVAASEFGEDISVSTFRPFTEVHTLSCKSPTSGGRTFGTGQLTSIYYLKEHDRFEVIEKFIEANDNLVDGLGEYGAYRRLQQATGTDWNGVIREVWKDRGWSRHHGNEGEGGGGAKDSDIDECPLCGEEFDMPSLSGHLPKCPER